MYLSDRERIVYKQLFYDKYFQQKLEYTRECIKKMLSISNCYVSFSFWKDSIVMSHIIRQIDPNIPHIFTWHDETEYILNTEDVDVRWINLKKIKLSETPFDEYWNVIEVHQRPATKEFIDEIKKYDWVFKWIRADEAKYRSFAVYKRKDNYMIHEYNIEEKQKKNKDWFRRYTCFPIWLWRDKDIKIYLSYYDLAIPRQYETQNRTSAWVTAVGGNFSPDIFYHLKTKNDAKIRNNSVY